MLNTKKNHKNFIKNKSYDIYKFSLDLDYIPKNYIKKDSMIKDIKEYVCIVRNISKNKYINILAIKPKYMLGGKVYVSEISKLNFNDEQIEYIKKDYCSRLSNELEDKLCSEN